jgi:HEAT repeat protein
MGKAEVEALAPLLEAEAWHLNRAVIGMLGLSGRPEAVPSILAKLRSPTIRDRNLNRVLGALGLLRCRQAVPDMLKDLARGRAENWGTEEYNGDRAEQFAATALGRVADPASVEPVIAQLASAKGNTPAEALRALSMMFDPQIPDDMRVLPTRDRLERVRIDRLPPAEEIKTVWEAFWDAAAGRYEWSEAGPGLRVKDGK